MVVVLIGALILTSFGLAVWVGVLLRRSRTSQGHHLSLKQRTESIAAERDCLKAKLCAERARFETILKQIPAAIAIIEAPSGKMILANRQLADLWAIKGPIDEVPPEQFQFFDSNGCRVEKNNWMMWRTFKTGQVENKEFEILRFDATRASVNVTMAPILDAEGQVIAAVAIVIDITDQKRARQALVESEERFRNLANAVPQIVWTADETGEIDYVNQQWYNYFGLGRSYCRKDWRELIHPDDMNRSGERWRQCVASGEEYRFEYRLRGQDSTHRWFLVRGIPTIDRQGKTRWFGTCTDIDEQKVLQRRLERAITYRDDFLSMASHELKTPLTSLKLHIQLVRRSPRAEPSALPGGAKLARSMDLCLLHTKRLEMLVDDLLDVSRIRTGRMRYFFERIDLVALVRSTIERLKDQMLLAECPIRLDCPEYLYVVCDSLRMEQVLTNLMTNAAKYGAGKPIDVSVGRNRDSAVIHVKDSGVGIAKENHNVIFEPFERLSEMTKIGGMGLGLFISRQLVTAHHGQIFVDSEPGKYSDFSVQFPMKLRQTQTGAAIS